MSISLLGKLDFQVPADPVYDIEDNSQHTEWLLTEVTVTTALCV